MDSAAFSDSLLQWHQAHGRHSLPWQHPRTPYRVWLSEIMLQQTQVVTVIPYFERFIKKFDSVEALAKADEDDVLALWAGLGYYARARNLHKAAKTIAQNGHFPKTVDEWSALPGVGQSTAAAIIAQSLNQRAPILDGNVKRVLSRVTAFGDPIDASTSQATLWSLADSFTPLNEAANYTQAIMDLGATVCTRSRPLCSECPVQSLCLAFAQNKVADLPQKRPKKQKPTKTAGFVVYLAPDDYLWLEKRPSQGIWGGLWCLPEYPLLPDQCEAQLSRRHTFTHYHLDYQLGLITMSSIDECPTENGEWIPLKKRLSLGLPAPIQRSLNDLEELQCLKCTV